MIIKNIGHALENLVAISLYKLQKYKKKDFGVYYDSIKGGLLLLLNHLTKKQCRLKLELVEKNKKQITKSMKRYASDYGIFISNKTDHTIKKEDIIFILMQTFSLI